MSEICSIFGKKMRNERWGSELNEIIQSSIYEATFIFDFRILEARVEELMAYRGDYPNYYVRPTISGKYFRYNVEEVKELQESRGQEIEMEDLSIPSEK